MSVSIDIIIPSFKGLHLLKKHLPTVIKNSPQANIIVVDDGPDHDTRDYLKKTFPNVRYIQNESNLGFPKTVNKGVAASKADYVVILNNDVSPLRGYLDSPKKMLRDPEIFAVTFNEKDSSWPNVSWSNGKISFTRGKDKSRARFSAWASGGSSILKRKIWNELGGFNEIYSPGYWEDIDLGWRAWQAGYKIVWDSDSKILHQHESTFKTLDQKVLSLRKQRNELLFLWQNITDPRFCLDHLRFLLVHSFTHPGYVKVVFLALVHLSKVLGQRSIQKGIIRISDKDILKNINRLYAPHHE